MKIITIIFALILAPFTAAEFTTDTAPYTIVDESVRGFTMLADPAKGSSLAKLGVKKEDVVISVNYQPILNREAAESAYNSRNPQSVSVLRKGQKILFRSSK